MFFFPFGSLDLFIFSNCVSSAPCLPRDITVEVNCTSDNAVLVSWNGTYGTTNISLMAVVGGSLQTLCTTQQESCNMTSLSCGETYSLSINASNDQCSLSTQTLSNFTTREWAFAGNVHAWLLLISFAHNKTNINIFLRSLPSSESSCQSAVQLPYCCPILGREA